MFLFPVRLHIASPLLKRSSLKDLALKSSLLCVCYQTAFFHWSIIQSATIRSPLKLVPDPGHQCRAEAQTAPRRPAGGGNCSQGKGEAFGDEGCNYRQHDQVGGGEGSGGAICSTTIRKSTTCQLIAGGALNRPKGKLPTTGLLQYLPTAPGLD